ncbi:RMD1 family protein [Roseococcus sp. YIM B11640]|uniref:RMD1 family protein n=1 Tax=Roseococcus sp. YIM B11640 TaxID=3133973 RepID=UPI003C7B9CBD
MEGQRPALAAALSPARLRARAVLLGERIDLRGLARAGGSAADPVHLRDAPGEAAFAFRWGAVVFFGGTEAEQAGFLAGLATRIASPLESPVEESAWVSDGAPRDEVSEDGEVHLVALSAPRLALLAEALAKSAALSHQEAGLTLTLDGIEPIVETLRRRGRLGILSRGLLRAIGGGLAARSHATARIRAADRPETIWEHPELERLHLRLAEEFELADRSAALDAKLVVIGETMQTLLSLIQGQRSQVLEIAVALFIGIEVVATVFGLFRGG